jgi:orotate phosphoribosyltransferase-like protein
MPVIRKHEKYCDDVRRLSEAGLSDPEIVRELNLDVSHKTITRRRKKYNIPPGILHRPSKTDPHADTIIKMRKSGAYLKDIAHEIGVSESAVQKFIARNQP